MKNFYFSLFVLLFLNIAKNTNANCPASIAPTNPQASGICNKGYSLFTANINDLTNTLVWLDSANRIIGVGNNLQQYIDKIGLTFKVAEVGYDALSTKVGPTSNQFTSTYPSQNFTNGQYFTCATTVRIDSILLRSNNALAGNIQIWSKAPENGGYILQKIPFNITSSGPKNTRVPIGAVLTTGNYFMNVEITSGSGILYRAIDGAVYPYNVSNLISITGTNFIGDLDRYYYFFDWNVSKMCMSPMSASFSPNITQPTSNIIPYYDDFDKGIQCNWENNAPSINAKWIAGNPNLLSSPTFPIPNSDTTIIISNDISCHCDKSSVKLESPWFDLRDYSKESTVRFSMQYMYKEKNNSKVYIRFSNANNTIVKLDSLSNQINGFNYYMFELRDFILSDSVRFSIEHKDNGGDSSAIAIRYIILDEGCSTSTRVNLNVQLDTYASEISWEIRDQLTKELIVKSLEFEDNNPYDTTKAKVNRNYCLIKGRSYTFKIKDSFGDGLDDGTHIGKYTLLGMCGDTILHGSGALPYGGLVLPNMAWDSINFIAGMGAPIDIGPDVVLNFNDTLIIDAGPNWKSYQWSNGDTTQTLTLIGKNYLPGKYKISLSVVSPNGQCVARDTINLEILTNYQPTLVIGVITDTKGSDIKWELRDKLTDTLIMTRGPFQDVIPYNLSAATHIDTVTVEYAQLLEFKIIDLSGNGLNDGTNQGKAWIGNNCSPELYINNSVLFPYLGVFTRYDSTIFTSSIKPKFNLGADVILCDGDSILLNASTSSNEYIWSTGESTKEIKIKSSDLVLGDNIFWVSNYQGVCNSIDSIKITKSLLPSTNFTTSQVGGKITCMGTSTGQQAYHWDFGDGSSANTRVATHQFATNGNYVVTYTITSNDGCTNSINFNVTITGVGINNSKAIRINIMPNPSDGEFKIEASCTILNLDVMDVQGRKLQSISNDKNSQKMHINLRNMELGMYFLKIKTIESEIVKYISIKR